MLSVGTSKVIETACISMGIFQWPVRPRGKSDVSGMQKPAKQIVSNIAQSQIHLPEDIVAINSILAMFI